MQKLVKDTIQSFPSSKGRIQLIASYSEYSLSLCFSPRVRLPLYKGSMKENLTLSPRCSERMLISYQRGPRMVSIIVKGTLFLYHLLVWKSCTLSRTRCQCLKWKLTRRIHNLLEFAFDLGWPIMTGPRRDYGISHRTSTPRYEMVSLVLCYTTNLIISDPKVEKLLQQMANRSELTSCLPRSGPK